jgi:hypothetical protein
MDQREAEVPAREYALAHREAEVRAREYSLEQDEARLGEVQRLLEEKESALDDEKAALQAQQHKLEAERAKLLDERELLAAAWGDWETAMNELDRLNQLAQAERQEARAIRRWSLVAVGLASTVATLSVAVTLRRVGCASSEPAGRGRPYLAGKERLSSATSEKTTNPGNGDGRRQPASEAASIGATKTHSSGF